MNVFDLFKPKWFYRLPQHLRPPTEQRKKIEVFREEYGLSDDNIFLAIISHPITTYRIQRQTLEMFKRRHPNATMRELWKLVWDSRMDAMEAHGLSSPRNEYAAVMSQVTTFDELCDFFIGWDGVQGPKIPGDPIITAKFNLIMNQWTL